MTEEARLGFAPAEFVKDPETGEVLAVERTPEYHEAIRNWHANHCDHPDTAPMRILVANGRIQVRNCCTNCGERTGNALSQRDVAWVDSLPTQSPELAGTYKSRRFDERQVILLELARQQYAERGRFTKSYQAYIVSDAWKAKRELVLKRCGGVCEGCGVKPATDAHHISYYHLFDEFLFELLGLCHDCHEKIEAEKRERRGIVEEVEETEDFEEPEDQPF